LNPANRCRSLDAWCGARSADLSVSEADRDAKDVPDADGHIGQHAADNAHVGCSQIGGRPLAGLMAYPALVAVVPAAEVMAAAVAGARVTPRRAAGERGNSTLHR
jgi:hypothetical protein